MEINHLVAAWMKAGNQYDLEKYLSFYSPHVIMDDPSVGKKFIGHQGIKAYFEAYFVAYQTQTTLVDLTTEDENHAHLEVTFTGLFPEGKIGGMSDFTFEAGKIAFVKADLIQS